MKKNQINKLKLLITGAFVVFAQFVFAQSSTYEKMLINDDETSRYDVEGSFINSSGSIVVYGYQSKNNYDPFYLELDPATGDTLKWVDATGTLFPERMQSMVELPTGGYIGVGYTTRSNQNYPWIKKLYNLSGIKFTKRDVINELLKILLSLFDFLSIILFRNGSLRDPSVIVHVFLNN